MRKSSHRTAGSDAHRAARAVVADPSRLEVMSEDERIRLRERGRRRVLPRRRGAPPPGEGAPAPAARREAAAATTTCSPAPASAGCGPSRCSRRPTCSRPKGSRPTTSSATTTTRSAAPRTRSTATCARSSSRVVHHFYDQLCPSCAEFNYAKRTESADLRGRVALLTGGRVKIGYQAGIKLLRAGRGADRHHPLPARRRAPVRPGARLRRLGRPARDLRPRPALHAERRGVLPPPRHHARPARLHREQRVPDRAPAARVLRHMMDGRDRSRSSACPADVRALVGDYAELPRRSRRRRDALAARAAAGRGASAARPLPGRPPRPGPAAGRSARPELVAADAGRGADRRAARDATGERGRAVRAERAAQAADAAHARARQARRERVGGRGAVLPAVQDHEAPAHEHGQGRAQHDDAHRARRSTTPTAST